MKSLWSWITDPCVHLVLIGLVFFHLSMNPRNDLDKTDEDIVVCKKCDQTHPARAACPVIATISDSARVLD